MPVPTGPKPGGPVPAAGPVPAPGSVESAAQARALVGRVLHGTVAAGTQVEADALLVTTELVVNAIRHAGGVTAFAAALDPGAAVLHVTVEDADPRHPRGAAADLDDATRIGGRGWPLVRLLATTVDVRALPGGGKRIHITLTLRPGPDRNAGRVRG